MIGHICKRTEPYYEYKFLIPSNMISHCLGLMNSLYKNTDPYPEDTVRSIYYDNLNYQNYYDCINGESLKKKFRVRKYPNFYQAQIKFKVLNSVSKIKYNIKDYSWPNKNTTKCKDFKNLITILPPLVQVCKISYTRNRYVVHNARVCLDHNIRFESMPGIPTYHKNSSLNFGILEIKTNEPNPKLPLMGNLSLKMVSFSKYLIGLNLLRNIPDSLSKYI
jgi:hypothetical protein